MTSHSSNGWISTLRIIIFSVILSKRAGSCLLSRVKSLIRNRSIVLDMVFDWVLCVFSLYTCTSWISRPISTLPISVHVAEVGCAFLSFSLSSQYSLPVSSKLRSSGRFGCISSIVECAKELLLLFAFLNRARRLLLSSRFCHLFGFGASWFDLFVVLALLDQALHLLKQKRLKKLFYCNSRLR